MSPSRQQIQPTRPIAEFGEKENPLFRVEHGQIPGQDEADDKELFLISDADDALPETLIGAGELDNINPEAGTADLGLELDTHRSESTYELSPGDIVGAIGAVAKDSHVTEVRLADVQLPSRILDRIVGPAELASNNPDSEPFEFKIAA